MEVKILFACIIVVRLVEKTMAENRRINDTTRTEKTKKKRSVRFSLFIAVDVKLKDMMRANTRVY